MNGSDHLEYLLDHRMARWHFAELAPALDRISDLKEIMTNDQLYIPYRLVSVQESALYLQEGEFPDQDQYQAD